MDSRSLHDGREDGLEPLESLSLDGVTSFRGLLRAMSKTAFSGRQLGEAYDVLLQMIGDPSCRTVLTISGAMTVAKQGRIICDMIDRGLVNAVIATGALIAHGLTEGEKVLTSTQTTTGTGGFPGGGGLFTRGGAGGFGGGGIGGRG